MKTQTNIFWRGLGRCLPDSTKRMVLIMSLYGHIHKRSKVSDETLTRINQALHLSQLEGNFHALELPLMMQKVIWNGAEFDEAALSKIIAHRHKRVLEEYVKRISATIPAWLRYSGQEDDVRTLLTKLPEFQPV